MKGRQRKGANGGREEGDGEEREREIEEGRQRGDR